MELMYQAIAINGPLTQMRRGPKRSTRRPPKGTTKKVSVAMAIEKVHCNAAVPHPYLRSIELTNSVQPYCRLAIATMQTMPRMSWLHRLKASPSSGDLVDAAIISAGLMAARPSTVAY